MGQVPDDRVRHVARNRRAASDYRHALGTPWRQIARHVIREAFGGLILREGLSRLPEEAGFEVVGLAADAELLLELIERTQPDVAIIDIRMPPTDTDEGLRAAKTIRERWSAIGILVLSHTSTPARSVGL